METKNENWFRRDRKRNMWDDYTVTALRSGTYGKYEVTVKPHEVIVYHNEKLKNKNY